MEKPCVLSLVDDTLFEDGEELRLLLGSPKSDSQFGASLGAQSETLVKIKDTADSESKVLKKFRLKLILQKYFERLI